MPVKARKNSKTGFSGLSDHRGAVSAARMCAAFALVSTIDIGKHV
jgi:hypothetical protein